MIRLEKLLSWSSAITYDDAHVINEYIATLSMHTDCADEREQTIAYDRMKWWVSEVLSGSVLINQQDPLLHHYLGTRQRVLVVPSDPVDHLMTMLLYLKLNAIMEGRLIIDEIKLSSECGDHMCYLHSEHTDGVVFDTQGWWADPRPIWQDIDGAGGDPKVVELCRQLEWTDFGLGWAPPDEHSSKILFPDFGKK